MGNTTHTFHRTALHAVNEALVTLGQDILLTAETFSETGTEANGRKAAYMYEGSRLAVLRAHPWGFARRTLRSCGCSCAPDGGPDGAHFTVPMPPRCVRIVSCRGEGGRIVRYVPEGRTVRSWEPICEIAYVQDVEDLDRWSPDAYRALVLRLAADLAKPVTGRISERQLQEQAYVEFLEQAKLSDARESSVPYDPYGENHYVAQMRGTGRR